MSFQIDNRAIKKALNKVNNSEKLNRSLKKRSEDYFGGTVIDENQAIELLKKSDTLNLVGNDIVDLAINLELVSIESIKKIEGVSFGLIYKFLQ